MTTRAKREPPAATVDRPLPHDLDAERAVLGALLIQNDLYPRVAAMLKPGDFYRRAHALVYGAIREQVEQPDGLADALTVREALKRAGQLEEIGGFGYLSKLTDGVPRYSNVGAYAEIVRQKAISRRLIQFGDDLLGKAYADERPVEELVAEADRAIIRIRHGLETGRTQSLAAAAPAFVEDFEYRIAHKGELIGVDTGFKSINEVTSGWQRGDMIVVAARPSIGKTMFALNTAVAAARSFRADETSRVVMIFSLEMSLKQLQYRLLASLSGVSLSRLTSGYLSDQSPEWPQVLEALATMQGMRLEIDDTSGRTVDDVRAECRRLQAHGGLDLVVVDYIQLMRAQDDGRRRTRNDEVTEISRQLKTLAKELDCPVIVVSQLNRAGEARGDTRPRLTDLRESGALEQDADIVCFLHRKHHREGGSTEFILEKQRNGPTGTVHLNLLRDIARFEDGGEPPPEPTSSERQQTEREKTRALLGRRARS